MRQDKGINDPRLTSDSLETGQGSAVGQGKRPWTLKMHLYRLLLFILPVLFVGLSVSRCLRHEAEPFTPQVGQIFPREPVLQGEYRFIVRPGNKNFWSSVDSASILCSPFSFYNGTPIGGRGPFDCNFWMKNLQGKQVEVHRVRVPTKTNKAEPRVVKIISEGRIYKDLSDDQVRERWLRDTNININIEAVFLAVVSMVLFWPLSKFIANLTRSNRNQGGSDRVH